MILINNTSTDPYFNAAAEEYLLKCFSVPVFMMWQNEPAVVIGRHQDVFREVNLGYTETRDIKIVRRFSGGGTVYHDSGNINLTFINQSGFTKFDLYTGQIIEFLAMEGIRAYSDSRNSVYINGRKFSGSAQYIRGDKVLFHSTLLFSSDLTALEMALDAGANDPSQAYSTDMAKYVQSVKSPVTNLADHLPQHVSTEQFKTALFNYFKGKESENTIYSFNNEDVKAIEKLKREKYSTTEWNYKTLKSLFKESCSV